MNIAVVKRYTKALIDLAREDNQIDNVLSALNNLAQAWNENKELEEFVSNPIIPRENREQAVLALAQRLEAPEIISSTIKVLAANDRLSMIPDLAQHFQVMADREVGRIRAQVESAKPLDEALMNNLQQKLSHTLKAEVVLESIENPALIGGFKVHVEDRVFDNSLQNSLNKLQDKLSHLGN